MSRARSFGRAVGDQWLVSGGLAVGERIVVEGLQKVRPGMAVKEVPLKAETPAANAAAGNAGTE